MMAASRTNRRSSVFLIPSAIFMMARPVRSLSSSPLPSLLKNPSLLSALEASKTKTNTYHVCNPAEPDSILAKVPVMNEDDARDCIERASHALRDWRDGRTAVQRANLLTKWSSLIEQNANDLATIMTLESGKPMRESLGEVEFGRSFLDYFAAEAVRPSGASGGFLVPTPYTSTETGAPRGHIMAVQQAVGVVCAITPWNFPLAMITRKIGPALAAGCTAVMKPSELTPLTALALQKLAYDAGIPEDVLQMVTPDRSSTKKVGREICVNPAVQKISFTGSTAVGKLLVNWSSGKVKRLSLELGGNAPFVVFDDADLDQAVDAAIASKYRNAGQTCVCADRFLVQAGVHDEFVKRFADKVKEKISNAVGPGMEDTTVMGPLITQEAVKAVDEKVQHAIARGAECVIGGHPLPDIGPNFYEPTILTNVSPKFDIWAKETFGPVAPIMSFETEEEALRIANDCTVGLASYFCTKDLSRAFRFSHRIESGLVGVNEGIISNCYAPFGGVKDSGLGREGSPLGLQEYLETKYIFMNV